MGLENRDYLRDEARRYGDGGGYSGGGYSTSSDAPMCRRILIVTIVVFVLQMIATRQWTREELEARRQQQITQLRQLAEDNKDARDVVQQQIDELTHMQLDARNLGLPRMASPVTEWLRMETPKVFSGQIWRLVTYAFCHSQQDILHILFNMLFLWWFGQRLEQMYGSREFLTFYLSAAFIAGVSYVLLDLVTGDPHPMVGASGSIMAIVTLFALHFPTQVIYIFFVIPVQIRWVVVFYAAYDAYPVLLALGGNGVPGDNIAHAAHLGGLAFGYWYGKRQFRLWPMVGQLQMWWRRKRSGLKVVGAGNSQPSRSSQKLADDMDRILKKISEEGEASLTSAERKTLERASRELRERRT